MLTAELIRANATLAGLTDEQVSALTEMSKNDEASVIGTRIGEIYGGLDTDIQEASGIAKNGTEKTYDYAKRVIGEMKAKAASVDDLTSQVAVLTKEKERLEGVVAKGGTDAETKKQLAQAKTDLENVTRQYTELKAQFDTEKASHEKALFDVKLDNEMSRATVGLKFKSAFPESVTSVILRQAIEKVKGMNPEYIDDGNGGKVLAFMRDGAVMRNPDTNLKPYTATELVAKELTTMGVLDTGRKQTGTGTPQAQPIKTEGGSIDLSGARTQVEASDMLKKALLSMGLTVGSNKYQEQYDAAWKDNNVTALPLK